MSWDEMNVTLETPSVEYPTLDDVMRKPWWTSMDVAVYLNPEKPSVVLTRNWMWREGVRRSKSNRTLTCREWVDAVLRRKS